MIHHCQYLLLVIAAGLYLFGTTAAGAEEYAFVTLEYPPLEYKDADGQAKGIAVEVVNRIMTALGHQVSMEVLPWTRALKMVRYGQADAIFTIFKNSEREVYLDFSREVLIPQRVALYARAESPITFDGDLAPLAAFRIGVVSTISYGRQFDRLRPSLTVERTASLEQNFTKLMHDRLDLVINNVDSAETVMRKLQLVGRIKQLGPVVEEVPSYIAFSKKKDLSLLKQDFDRQLKQFKTSGRYAAIMEAAGLSVETSGLED